MGQRTGVAIVGAGAWGTALAAVIARLGRDVRLWGRRPELIRRMRCDMRNPEYLSDHALPAGIQPFTDLAEAVDGVDIIIVVPASDGMRTTAEALRPHYHPRTPVISATKGLEPHTDLRMTQVLGEVLGIVDRPELLSLSGPNFAVEIMAGLPAGTVVASRDESVARMVQELINGPQLRIYTSDDLVGVELGGALKNVYAIAVGVVHSLGLGMNAQATLITRGLAELTRLGASLGAHPLTFAGLSGLGDLVLTCTSDLSRNRRAGLALGAGTTPEDIRTSKTTVEGIRATWAARDLATRCAVDMPIVQSLFGILYEGKNPEETVEELMERQARTERDRNYELGIEDFLRRQPE